MTATAASHNVRDELLALLTPVADLHNHPDNPRRGDVDRLAESLDRFGQYRPIVCTTDGTILAGNHTYRAAVARGWTHVAATRGEFTPAEADALLVADNRHSDLSTNDDPALLAIIRRHNDDFDTWLSGTGFDLSDVSQLEEDVAALGLPDLDSGAGGDPDPDADPGNADDGEERGSKLAVVDVTIDEPKTLLERGAQVRLGRHWLHVESVYTGWSRYSRHLVGDAMLVPYPTPTVPLAERAQRVPLVLVQPDPYLAGHLVDKYVSVFGADDVEVVAYA